MITLVNALRDAGRENAARHVAEQASQLDPPRIDTSVQPGEGNRGPIVTNEVSDVDADTVVQVGVVHGDLRIHSEPRKHAAALQVSVTTEQKTEDRSDKVRRADIEVRLDTKIHVFVEAFTSQAVILRQLRPVVVRRIDWLSKVYFMKMPRREFNVRLDPSPALGHLVLGSPPDLDLPSTSYDASLDEQALNLDAAFAAGTADFPFRVTASDPEYFVIVPQPHQTEDRQDLVEWRLELDWSCLGQHGTVTIDHGHEPFLSAL